MNNIEYKINISTLDNIKEHLNKCSINFTPALDTYTNIEQYSEKIFNKAIRFEAFNKSTLIGLIAMYVNSNRNVGFITNVSVDTDYKGRNIGGQLIDEVKKYAFKNNITSIELEAYNENIKAINFYHKHGFNNYGSTLTTLLMNLEIKRNYNKELQDTADHKYAYNFDFDIMHPYMIKSFEPFFKGNDVLELGSFKGNRPYRLCGSGS